MKNILIIGANSAIAEACAKQWAEQGYRFYLLARNTVKLKSIADDLTVRGADSVNIGTFDACEFGSHAADLNGAIQSLGHIDIVLIAHGTLSDQSSCENEFEAAITEFKTNALSYFSLLSHLANYFEQRKQGCIAVIGSVAGDRGRQSNYIYGSAKGAVDIYLQGLRQRMFKHGVHILTIKPGFVDTPMTRNFKKGILWEKPETVAKSILTAIEKKRNTIYTPWFWYWIMLIIKNIPEPIFKKISL